MNVETIKRLEDLIPLDKGCTIVTHKITRLTTAGENYGSLMLSVNITVKNSNEDEETIHAVAKMVPPNEIIQKFFNTQVTFRNEIGFYDTIVPTLRSFQREQGIEKLIDFFPEYYGSRINLNGGTIVDTDAALLLENLKVSNFENLDRTQGFDLETAKLVIVDLAYLHAVPLALKLKKPEVFEDKVKKYLTIPPVSSNEEFRNKLLGMIEGIDDCKAYISRVKAVLQTERKKEIREPFATISHNDVWTNNTMVKMKEGKSVKNKLVDFQVCDYGSPAKDVLFFIFSSLQNGVLENYCDHLIKFYHDNLGKILEELKCNTAEFSFEQFLKEVVHEAPNQLVHIIFMLIPIFAPKGSVKDISELSPGDFMKSMESPPEAHKKKLALVIKEFAKRNWI